MKYKIFEKKFLGILGKILQKRRRVAAGETVSMISDISIGVGEKPGVTAEFLKDPEKLHRPIFIK
jgi:hypothetical protein